MCCDLGVEIDVRLLLNAAGVEGPGAGRGMLVPGLVLLFVGLPAGVVMGAAVKKMTF